MNTTIQIPSRQRLVAERLRRRWTQLEVADQLGTTPGNVSRWERGITSPGPYFRRKLCELFGRSAQELGLSWDESDDFLSPHTYASALAASFHRDTSLGSYPIFIGHEDLLALLHTLLRPDTTALSSVWASSGPGGLNLPEQENGDRGWQWLRGAGPTPSQPAERCSLRRLQNASHQSGPRRAALVLVVVPAAAGGPHGSPG